MDWPSGAVSLIREYRPAVVLKLDGGDIREMSVGWSYRDNSTCPGCGTGGVKFDFIPDPAMDAALGLCKAFPGILPPVTPLAIPLPSHKAKAGTAAVL